MSRHNPYTVPEKYFDHLNTEILCRTVGSTADGRPTATDQSTKSVSWGEAWKRMSGFAAAFALMIGIGWGGFYFATKNSDDTADQWANHYLDTAQMLYTLDEDQVIEIISEQIDNKALYAEQVQQYVDFYGAADDENFIYYE